MKRKNPLRSSKDIYDRLKWDAAFPVADVYIGYRDRMEGMKELPFADFRPGGRIPWDRVRYFRMGDKRIWDRDERIDLVFGSGESNESEKVQTDATETWYGPEFTQISWYRYQSDFGAWSAAQPHSESVSVSNLAVLTWNILMDDHEPWTIRSDLRYPEILSMLEQSGATFIALQEVQLPFLQALLQEKWVRDHYYVSDNSEGRTLTDYGQILLSRIPPESLWLLKFEGIKRVIAGHFNLNGQKLTVPVVHLTSNRTEHAPEVRAAQIETIAKNLPPDARQLWLGDFNMLEGEEMVGEWVDVWRKLRPEEAGFTYDPGENRLAGLFSRSGVPKRYDRMLLSAGGEDFRPVAVNRVGTEPIAGIEPALFPSDHFGLLAEFSLQRSAESQPLRHLPTTHQSALVILPPRHLWGKIQGIRRNFDPAFHRWMPHINLLYGFLPEAHFERAAGRIREVIAGFDDFDVTLERVDHFEHKSSATLWLAPDAQSARKIQELQQKLLEIFPQCTEQNRDGSFTPHLSIAKLSGAERKQVAQYQIAWDKFWEPLSFSCGEICLISRGKDTPFEIQHRIPFGNGTIAEEVPLSLQNALGVSGYAPSGLQSRLRNSIFAELEKAVKAAFPEASLRKVGSFALGVDLATSDMDLVFESKTDPDAFLSAIQSKNPLKHWLTGFRKVSDSNIPVLELQLAREKVDIQFVSKDASDETAQLVRAAALEPGLILDYVGENYPNWQIATRVLQAWATAQGLKGNAFGMLPGLALSILSAMGGLRQSPEKQVYQFFWDLSLIDSTQPLALGERPEGPQKGPWRIFSTAKPRINILRNQIDSLCGILIDQCYEIHRISHEFLSGARSWEELFRLAEPEEKIRITLRIEARNGGDLSAAIGYFHGRIRAFLETLEPLTSDSIRPYTNPAATGRGWVEYRIGTDPRGIRNPEIFEEATAQFCHKLNASTSFSAAKISWRIEMV